MVKIQTIETREGFQNVREEWNRLLSDSPVNNIFLTWEWLYTWWETYSYKKHLHILLFREDDGPIIGIAPFYTTYERILGITIRFLKLIGSEEVCSEYLDIIIRRDRIDDVIKSTVSNLQRELDDLDIVYFKDVTEDSLLHKVSLNLRESNNIIYQNKIKTTNPFISLAGNEDLFFENLSNKGRQAIKDIIRREKKLKREHEISYHLIKGKRDLEGSFNNFVSLHQKLWRSRCRPGMFKRRKFLQFHQGIVRKFAENGWLRLYFLSIKRKPAASLYGFQYDNKFYYYQSGFDPDWKVYGVGKIILYHSIREAIRNKLKEFDFLRGEAHYKSGFTDLLRQTREIIVARDTHRANFYLFVKDIRRHSKDFLKRFLPERLVKRAKRIREHIVMR